MISQADARHIPLADATVQCIVTSPPYWGLRDYGLATWEGGEPGCDHVERMARRDMGRVSTDNRAGNINPSPVDTPMRYREACPKCGAIRHDAGIGLESTPEQYIANIVAVFHEVWRVLRPDGTLWLNMGDCYGGYFGDNYAHRPFGVDRTPDASTPPNKPSNGRMAKQLMGIPWRVAFALQADGWWLRSDIIWAKPNPMPESVRDRPTKSHEYLFLLTKNARYYYDAEAIKELSVTGDLRRPYAPGQVDARGNGHDRGGGELRKQDTVGKNTYTGFNDRYNHDPSAGRNRRDVWTIPTQPYKGAHFATFPEKLAEPCILAGTSPKACGVCGAPWGRGTKTSRTFESGSGQSGNMPSGKNGPRLQGGGETLDIRRGPVIHSETVGWHPTCDHDNDDDTGKCLVLDPFCGSGTVGVVCRRHGRRFVGLDLSMRYLRDLALPRSEGRQAAGANHDLPLFAEAEAAQAD